jgi:hypothetical protein
MTEKGPEKLSAAIASEPDDVERALATAKGATATTTTTTTTGDGTR